MRLARTTVDRVRQVEDIVSIISEYVTLKRRGRNYIGLCPFHSEKSPSFTVSPEKKIFHCFGCHESGDLISFLEKIDNLSFTEAVVAIAEKSGIPVEEDESTPYPSQKNQYLEAMKELLIDLRPIFVSLLESNDLAWQYLLKRGLTEETIQTFHLGFCPDRLFTLPEVKEKNFDPNLLLKTGMAIRSDQGTMFPRFRNRIVFPVQDHRGKTVGYGGRLYVSSDGPKYINSMESPVFNKSKLLYGFSEAKSGIRRAESVILVEGYMDVIMLHQCGFKNAVASMGTALTLDQARLLARVTSMVYMAMDNDNAGQQAILKSYDVLRQVSILVKVVPLIEKDPADVVLEHGADSFQSLLDSAFPMIEFIFQQALKKYPASQIENIPKIIREVLPLLRSETDDIIRRRYIQKFSSELQIEPEMLAARVTENQYQIKRKKFMPKVEKQSKFDKAQEYLLYWGASDLTWRTRLLSELSDSDFQTENFKRLFGLLTQSGKTNLALLEDCPDVELKKHLSRVLVDHGQDEKNVSDDEWNDMVSVLKECHQKYTFSELKKKIQELEKSGKEEEALELLQKLKELKS